MLSWDEFIREYVTQWRSSFDEFIREYVTHWQSSFHELGRIQQSDIFTQYSLAEPVQVQVFTFETSPRLLWIVTHDKDRKDMEIGVQTAVESDISSFLLKKRKDDPEWYRRFKGIEKEVYFFKRHLPKIFSSRSIGRDYWLILYKESIIDSDPRVMASADVAHIAYRYAKETESSAISRKAEEIKSAAGLVLDEDQRKKLLDAAREIETSLTKLKRLEEHDQKITAIEEEIDGVRKLIGTSKEYQDWKVLVGEVADFKKIPHVTKELFDSEVKRLDQRIDSLREIRFWSKRTALDIGLAVLATATTIIAALLGTGIIHF